MVSITKRENQSIKFADHTHMLLENDGLVWTNATSASPLSLLDTDLGSAAGMNSFGRIEDGVFI